MKFKWAVLLIFTIVFQLCLPFYANAIGKFEPPWLSIKVLDPPADLVYLDILIPKGLPEVHMDSVNQSILASYPVLAESLSKLDSNGYVSYSLYFTNAYPDLLIRPNEMTRYFAVGQLNLIKKLKIVALNEKGQILKISNTISIHPDILHSDGVPSIQYQYTSNIGKVNFEVYFLPFIFAMIIKLLIFGVPSLLLSTFLETVAASLLNIKPVTVVLFTNLITQGLVALGTPYLALLLPFSAAFIVFELLATISEYIVFMKKMTQTTRIRIIIFILFANFATAILNACIFGGIYGYFRI